MAEVHTIKPEHAERMWTWLQSRGGIAIWRSINLSNPGASWSSPALATDGTPTPKPTWEAANAPERIITDPAEVHVTVPREVKRFHVALRVGSQGFMVKLTDGSSRRVRSAVARAEEKYGNAWYEFDYEMQEAVIYVGTNSVPLAEWMRVPLLPSTETVADKGAAG